MRDSVDRLRERLVGKTIVSVDHSRLPESHFFIRTSDGQSVHICGNDLGSWIVDGPLEDGTYPSIASLARAVGDYRYEKSMYEETSVEVVGTDGLLLFDAGDGKLFSIRPSGVKDEWERRVLTHARAAAFLRNVVMSGEFWPSHFSREVAKTMETQSVPEELLLSPEELDTKV